jgi:hypothetical protein
LSTKKNKSSLLRQKEEVHIKSQIVVDKKCQKIICTTFSNDKRHNFRLFKESRIHIHPTIKAVTDTGYQDLQKLHANTESPKKASKKNPLIKKDKMNNRKLSSESVLNKNVIGMLKRFNRNRRKRFALRFNLISALYNWELEN